MFNYSVFDEKRYFSVGHEFCVVEIGGVVTAIMVCEDIWYLELVLESVSVGVWLVLNLNALLFYFNKVIERENNVVVEWVCIS